MSFPLGDGTVGVKQAELPDRFIANKKKTNQDDEVVYVQETYDEHAEAAINALKTAQMDGNGSAEAAPPVGTGVLGWLRAIYDALVARLGTLGQKAMGASTPVTIASDQTAVPVTGPLTQAQLLAANVAVIGPLTDAELRAVPVPVSGPLTDAQLRADPVPVSLGSVPLPAGAATEATLDRHVRGIVREITKTLRSDVNTLYIGHAPSGSANGDSVWTIEKLVFVDSVFDYSLWSAEGVEWDDVEITPYA
jgi:hypothetical protein